MPERLSNLLTHRVTGPDALCVVAAVLLTGCGAGATASAGGVDVGAPETLCRSDLLSRPAFAIPSPAEDTLLVADQTQVLPSDLRAHPSPATGNAGGASGVGECTESWA